MPQIRHFITAKIVIICEISKFSDDIFLFCTQF